MFGHEMKVGQIITQEASKFNPRLVFMVLSIEMTAMPVYQNAGSHYLSIGVFVLGTQFKTHIEIESYYEYKDWHITAEPIQE